MSVAISSLITTSDRRVDYINETPSLGRLSLVSPLNSHVVITVFGSFLTFQIASAALTSAEPEESAVPTVNARRPANAETAASARRPAAVAASRG